MNANERRLADGRRFGARFQTLRGSPIEAGGATLTPIARRVVIWSPWGVWAYVWPATIEYDVGRRIQRARITRARALVWAPSALFAIAGIAAAALAAQSLKRETETRTA